MIGIIGGNGVAATNKLNEIIEEKITLRGGYRDAHHPEIISWQATQVPSRSMYLEGRGKSFIPDYVRIGKLLKSCGCTELCMCCNTAHYAIDILEKEIGLPFINILDEVAIKANELGCKKIGMMCSDGLRKVGLYEERFKIYAKDTIIIYPSDKFQKIVTKGICNAKNDSRFLPTTNEDNPTFCFNKVVEHLIDLGVDGIVAGCTDICNVYTYNNINIKYIDSLTVLADSIIKRHSLSL